MDRKQTRGKNLQFKFLGNSSNRKNTNPKVFLSWKDSKPEKAGRNCKPLCHEMFSLIHNHNKQYHQIIEQQKHKQFSKLVQVPMLTSSQRDGFVATLLAIYS